MLAVATSLVAALSLSSLAAPAITRDGDARTGLNHAASSVAAVPEALDDGAALDAAQPAAEVAGESVVSVPADGVSAAGEQANGALEKAVAPEQRDVAEEQPELSPARVEDDLAVLTPVKTAATFTGAGITWIDEPGVTVTEAAVRVREAGEWTPWTTLEIPELDTASDGSGARAGTEPLITLGADAVQARVLTANGEAPKDVRVDLVNGGTAAATAPVAKTAAYRPVSVQGVALQPTGIVTRAQWGADEKKADTTTRRSVRLQAMYVHHTASSNNYTRAQAAQAVRSFYLFHTQSKDWDDIGYQFLIDKYGTIYEGRRGSFKDLVIGAQAGGFNTGTMGVSMIGNYETARPSAAGLEALRKVLTWKGYANGINALGTTTLTATVEGPSTSRYPDGARVKVPTILGHRTTNSTSCPGQYLFAQLPQLRKDVAARIITAQRQYGVGGSPLRAPVAAVKYATTAPVSTSGKLSLKWKRVSYAAKYQIMEREVTQSGRFSRNNFWLAGPTTSATSKTMAIKAGRTAVYGVRAIDAQGRPGPVTRLTQATRPVGLGSSDVKRKDFALTGKLSGSAHGKGWSGYKKGASLTVVSAVSAKEIRITAKAPAGATFKVVQGKKAVATIRWAKSSKYSTKTVRLPSTGRNNVSLTLSAKVKAKVVVKNIALPRATFTVLASTFVAPGAALPMLKAPAGVTVTAGAATGNTTGASTVYAFAPQKDAAVYVVQVDRAPEGKKLSGAWKQAYRGTATSVRVSQSVGETVRVRVYAVSVFGRNGSAAYFAPVVRAAVPVAPVAPAAPSTPAPAAPAGAKPSETSLSNA